MSDVIGGHSHLTGSRATRERTMPITDRRQAIDEKVREVAGTIVEMIDENQLADIPDEALGKLFASVITAYAAKVQSGDTPPLFAGNIGVTDVDVKISALAIIEAVGLNVFELGLWQSWSGLGKRKSGADATRELAK
jgi:hypothetical protein